MYEKTCSCTGHRPQNLNFGFNEKDEICILLKKKMRETIEKLILEDNVTRFISGMALGVDTWFAETVLELRDTLYPQISLEAAIPCETQASKWNETQRNRYFNIISRCDKETMLRTHYTANCMQRRNFYMVEHCDFLLAVWNGAPGGTKSTVKHAEEQNKVIICIDPKNLRRKQS